MISTLSRSTIVLLAAYTLMSGQEGPVAGSGGWRRASDVQQAPPQTAPPPADAFGQPLGQDPAAQQPLPPANLPVDLVLRPGTFVSVRINQVLSSDRNQQGDAFSATLMQPLVVDGVVVAQRNQNVYGRVAAVEKQRSSRPSQMALELTELTLADGTQVPVRSQLVGRKGGTAPAGEQFGTVATTTATGAMIGAWADWGRGAAIGAGIGAAAGLAGVMFTRNRPTVVYPEAVLTFRIDAPVTVSTARAPMAFRYVDGSDYDRPDGNFEPRPREPRRAYPPAYPPMYGPGFYGPGYYPYWGPSVAFVYGGGYFRGPGWGRYGGGWRRWR
jgi:hypothetical protein